MHFFTFEFFLFFQNFFCQTKCYFNFVNFTESIKTYGSSCPIALRLVACTLLFEITAFLRETYPNIPKSNRILIKDKIPPWEKIYSREANRRWSMALSSMGHSETSVQSLQSIVGEKENGKTRHLFFSNLI